MKIFCIGRNYIAHARELDNPVPASPVFFLKPDTALLRRNRPFYYPEFSSNIHYECELVVRICKLGKGINPQFAHTYYEEIGIGIDFTARDLQDKAKAKGLPWEIAKAFDHSAPLSELFINKNEFSGTDNIPFSLVKNGETVQQGNSGNMIFSIDALITYLSGFFTLKTGDLIFTGTPAGVGPVQPGDRLEAYIGDRLMLKCDIK
jgi:2-keto-4-pentenoate hydratase/2-oxohepta-3-ene-1,7-dioic acid hydratase in catechol pathway